MNEKEIGEIRRRITPEKNTISRIRGCYVTEQKEILSEFNQTFGLMSEIESEELLKVIKKTLSGQLGRNLRDIEFSTAQVVDGKEHKLLSALRDSSLEDDEAVKKFYQKVIDSVSFEGNYLILLATDKYDVFTYSGDGKKNEDSTQVFSYITCSVCPIKLTKPALSYYAHDNAFHSIAANSVISMPQMGFMFPAFDDRQTNIYGSLLYSKDISEFHDAFVENIFGTKAPMPASVEKETFESVLEETVADACSFDVLQAVHEKIFTLVEEHKAAKEVDPLMISKGTVKNVLSECGVPEEKITAFDEGFDEGFGRGKEVHPKNVIDVKKFEVKTPDVTIKVNPERTDLIKTEIIDGTKYILIRAESDVTVNGVAININD
jgi:hypothetical protein